MSFCKFSSEKVQSSSTQIENLFFTDFLPFAPEHCVKVYLYGLHKCYTQSADGLQNFSRVLNLSEEDIISCYYYWEEVGLVQIITKQPFEVRYLPIKKGSMHLQKFNANKYKDFNAKAQEIIFERMITPNEYQEYYYLIETSHIEIDALLMIMQYCVNLKNANVRYNYIISVARNWINDGILTAEATEERLQELKRSTGEIKEVLQALKLKRNAKSEEYDMFLEWTREMGFSLEIILYVAKSQTNKFSNFAGINHILSKCYAMKLFSINEISTYFESFKNYCELAKAICRNLGIRYDNVEVVVDTYIIRWINMGYDEETLKAIASLCFKSNTNTLAGMDAKINHLFEHGIVSFDALENFLNEKFRHDENIKMLLKKLNVIREVNNFDRNLYNTWIQKWGINKDLLDFAIELSKDKYMPIQYLNKVLSHYNNNNVKDIEAAKRIKIEFGAQNTNVSQQKKPEKRNYTSKQLNSLFTNLDEVEI